MPYFLSFIYIYIHTYKILVSKKPENKPHMSYRYHGTKNSSLVCVNKPPDSLIFLMDDSVNGLLITSQSNALVFFICEIITESFGGTE